jgi:perosamine synthetase
MIRRTKAYYRNDWGQSLLSYISSYDFCDDQTMTNRLEDRFKELFDRQYCLAVSNTSSAIFMCLYIWSKRFPGKNQVIIPNWGYPAAFKACKVLGLKPVPVDICRDTLGMVASDIQNCLTAETLAVVHIENNGVIGDPFSIREVIPHDVLFIEDSAPSMTQENAGKYGDVSMFSFSATKPLFAGEGSIILTDSREIHDDLRLLRHTPDYENMDGTLNFLLSPYLAAYILPQISSLNDIQKMRQKVHDKYRKHLNILEDGNNSHGMIMYLSEHAKEIHERLNFFSIEHRYQYYPLYNKDPDMFPVSHRVYNELIDLPMHHELTDEQIKSICLIIKRVEK